MNFRFSVSYMRVVCCSSVFSLCSSLFNLWSSRFNILSCYNMSLFSYSSLVNLTSCLTCISIFISYSWILSLSLSIYSLDCLSSDYSLFLRVNWSFNWESSDSSCWIFKLRDSMKEFLLFSSSLTSLICAACTSVIFSFFLLSHSRASVLDYSINRRINFSRSECC